MLAVVVMALLATGIYFLSNRPSNKNAAQEDSSSETINMDPPTEEEKAAADQQKDKNINRDETDKNTPPPTKNAQLYITDASQYDDTIEVRAYVSNVYEDNGTCKATFTQGGNSVSESSTAFKDATTTQCGTINIPRSKFPSSGQWQLVVHYSSSQSSGKTEPQQVTIN